MSTLSILNRVAMVVCGAYVMAGCSHKPEQPNPAVQTAVSNKGAALAAEAAVLETRKEYAKSIEKWHAALKEDSGNRQYQDGLAFDYSHSNHLPEARTLWAQLATGNDDIAQRAAKNLKKTSDAASNTK